MAVGFAFKQFSPFIETFNDKLGQLMEIGFRSVYEMDESVLNFDKRKEIDEISPQVLTMDHLGLGFLVCFIFLGLSIVLFFMENIFYKIEKVNMLQK